MRDSRSGRGFRRLLLLLLLVGLVFGGLAAFRVGPAAEITIEPGLPAIGKRTPVAIRVREPRRGLAGVRVELVQGERVEVLAEREHAPLAGWRLWGDRVREDALDVEVGSETIRGLQEGQATLRVTAERAAACCVTRIRPCASSRSRCACVRRRCTCTPIRRTSRKAVAKP
jgi:hypothetical protein